MLREGVGQNGKLQCATVLVVARKSQKCSLSNVQERID